MNISNEENEALKNDRLQRTVITDANLRQLIYDLFKYIWDVSESYGDAYNELERRAVQMGLALPDELRISEDA
jgi:hypothetical protein